MKYSLRTQLSLWSGFATIITVYIITFLIQGFIAWNFEKSINDSLQNRAHVIAALITSDITTTEESYAFVISDLIAQKFTFLPMVLRIVNPKAELIVEFGKVPTALTPELDSLLLLPEINKGRFDNVLIPNVEPLRIYSIAAVNPRNNVNLAFVQLGEPLTQVSELEQQLWINGLIIGAICSLLAIAITQALLWRGFRRLYLILQTIDNVDYHHLKTIIKTENDPAEIEKLARSLTSMWQRIDMAIDTKQMILNSISHDLRTPLTALQGQLEVMLLQNALSRENRDSLTRMLNETSRLIRMVNNMLLNVQLESLSIIDIAEVNLGKLIDEIVKDVWVLLDKYNFTVTMPLDIIIPGNSDLLKELIINILENSIKFTPKGGAINLTVNIENDWAVLQVSDTGCGISTERLPHITTAFYGSGKYRRSGNEGTRLGLAIVKQIVNLHHGLLDIQSREGSGTIVKVSLPKIY